MINWITNKVNWNVVSHFDRDEWKKNPDKVAPKLILTCNAIRNDAGVPFQIHVAYENGGHSKKSYHYKGEAVDFHFGTLRDGKRLTYLEQFALLTQYDLGGIGFYPFWNNPGWHIDLRVTEPRLYWWRDVESKYHYGYKEMAKALLFVNATPCATPLHCN